MGIKELFLKAVPLSKKNQEDFLEVEKLLSKKDAEHVKNLLKTKKISIGYMSLGLSKSTLFNTDYPHIYTKILKKENPKLHEEIDKLNKLLKDAGVNQAYINFSKDASNSFSKLLAPEIVGMDIIKEAVCLQLFSKEKIHILLLGDPGTGKTDVLRSASQFAPISSFGLGSGTSGVGLSVTFKGAEMIKGLLPQAHNGLCCIDELNLMKEEDMAALYSAMEKGFITYDKGGKHLTLETKINVLATGNPKNDKFTNWKLESIKKQIPFDSALLTRFQLIFLVKKPNKAEFEKISRKIIKHKDYRTENDMAFIKEYVGYARELNVTLSSEMEEEILKISSELKNDEEKLLFEVNPRIVHGLMRLVKASARMNLRNEVNINDVEKIKKIVHNSFYFEE